MFYENQPIEQQEAYKNMLEILGMLSGLFSDSDCPYLVSRSQENCFCKYFEAENLGRQDSSADAKKNRIGVGLKTWMGQNDQKVAEFGRLRPQYEGLTGIELVQTISEFRNERIRVTKNLNGIDEMIYHVVKRIPGAMQILECAFDPIDIANITLMPDRGNANNTYFTDGNHTYHFSVSKNTLYMIFEDMTLLDTVDVEILEDPFETLQLLLQNEGSPVQTALPNETETQNTALQENQICLRLYSENGRAGKFVPERSGLNQWNATGRTRHSDELYIPYFVADRNRKPDFFPARDVPFALKLPDGTELQAKVCQDGGKAIMSNPNKELGHWLLRDVLELPERTLITYDMLCVYGIDSVIFTKHAENSYSVDFCSLGTYDAIYNNANADEIEDE